MCERVFDSTLGGSRSVVKKDYSLVTKTAGRARCGPSRRVGRRPRLPPCAAFRPPAGRRPRATASSAAAAAAARPSPGPSTSVISPFGGSENRSATLRCGPPHDLLEALRQLPADRHVAAPASASASDRSEAGRRFGDSNATTGQRQPRELFPERSAARSPAAAGSRRTGTAPRRARSRRVPSRPPRRREAPSPAAPASSAARTSSAPRVGDPRQPGVGDERHALTRSESAAGSPSRARPRCARGTRAGGP